MRQWPLVLVAAAGLAFLGSAQARSVAEPIEGTWNLGSGQVLVTGSGGSFSGRVVKEIGFTGSPCTHPLGEVLWHLSGSGTHYEGDDLGFGSSNCSDRVSFPSTWNVTQTAAGFTVRFCSTITTDGDRLQCDVLTRARPPAPPAPPARSFVWAAKIKRVNGVNFTGEHVVAIAFSAAGKFQVVGKRIRKPTGKAALLPRLRRPERPHATEGHRRAPLPPRPNVRRARP